MHVQISLQGLTPYLMHNGRLADPLHPAAKALKPYTGKRQKTDEDHEAIARLEFEGAIYFDDQLGPFVPAESVHKSLVEGAKSMKQGRAVERSMVPRDDQFPLLYSGKRDIDSLYSDPKFVFRKTVVLNGKRTVRTRPRFKDWELDCGFDLDESYLDFDRLAQIIGAAGWIAGIGNWRPSSPKGGTFGRYTGTAKAIG